MINTIENERFYSPEELADQLKMSLSSIYKLIRTGGLPHIRLGKIYRIPASDLRRYLASKAKDTAIQAESVLPEVVNVLVAEAKKYSKNILEIWLFGSYARGDSDADSDVDLLFVLDEKSSEASRQVTELCERAMEAVAYEEILSPIEFSKKEWETLKKNRYSLAQSIEAEGKPLWKNH